jgi:hypothetical protein
VESTTVTLAHELGLSHEQVVILAEQTRLVFASEATGEVVDDAPVYRLVYAVAEIVRLRGRAIKAAHEVYPRTPDNFRDDSYTIKD